MFHTLSAHTGALSLMQSAVNEPCAVVSKTSEKDSGAVRFVISTLHGSLRTPGWKTASTQSPSAPLLPEVVEVMARASDALKEAETLIGERSLLEMLEERQGDKRQRGNGMRQL